MQIVRPAWLCAALLALAPLASATTYIVDPSGAGNFTDIHTAILACVPGDVLLVHAGTYAPFAVDRGITIIGYGSVNVSGGMGFAGIPAAQTGVLVRVQSPSLTVQGCAGHVIVQDLTQATSFSVSDSNDVRFARVIMQPHSATWGYTGVTLVNSRLELANCVIRGTDVVDCVWPGADGGWALNATTSRTHLANSALHGGNGSHCDAHDFFCGSGREGLALDGMSQAILCGGTSPVIESGLGSLNYWYNDCTHDGGSFCAISIASMSALRRSGVLVQGHGYAYGWQCTYVPPCSVSITSGTDFEVPIPDPSLSINGNPAPGSQVQFVLYGPPGATAVLSLGRNPIVQVDPNTVIEVLATPTRDVNLGTIPATGNVTFNYQVPLATRPGSRLVAQGRVTLPGGEVRRTNSVPVIVR